MIEQLAQLIPAEICQDSKGNIGEKKENPNWDGRLLVGTNDPDCICESYPCNCPPIKNEDGIIFYPSNPQLK